MKIKVKFTLEDYVKWSFRSFGRTLKTLAIACLIYIFYIAFDKSRIDGTLIWLLIFAFIFLVYTPIVLYFNAKNAYNNDKLMQEEVTYLINEKGFKTNSSYGSSDITWDKIYGATLNKKFITINPAKARGYILPGRFFKDVSEMRKLGDLLKKVLPKGRVKGKI